jgi:heptosyltransferase-2
MTNLSLESIKSDCRHFRGDIPCKPHKHEGVHCVEENGSVCPHYDQIVEHILIIKLGATGDVIRTTPLLTALKADHLKARIYWLTKSPEIVPGIVDIVLDVTIESIVYLRSLRFDTIINLDKDREACALASQLQTQDRKGFILRNGVPAPANNAAVPKFMTGLFDDVNKANTKSYLEEIFEICGYTFKGERYILENPSAGKHRWNLNRKKKIVGLNTGCGGRWTSRLWADKNWAALASTLKKKGYEVVLLGGEQEHKKNNNLAKRTGVKYLGHFDLSTFIDLMNQCDLIVTGVTMAMHLAIGLQKKIVLFNNIFNPREFELYGFGEILQPEKPCTCFFQPICTNPKYRCMDTLAPARVADVCVRLLGKPAKTVVR